MELKEKLINEIKYQMSFMFPYESIPDIEVRLYKALEPYDVIYKNNEIVEVNQNDNMKLLAMFIVAKKVQGCTKRTIDYYTMELRKFLIAMNKPVAEINANDIRFYIGSKDVSNTTRDNILRNIKSFFSWCTMEEYVPKNVTLKVTKIKADGKVKKALTETEIEMLRSAAADLRTKALIEVMLSTACRVSEISGMDIEDIREDELTVLGKGNKERVVYLNAKAQFAIDQYLESRADSNPALFVSLNRPYHRLKASGIEIIFRELGRSLGIESNPHKFRRTAATMALNRGMPLEQVQQMLGHEDPGTTLIYAKTASENLKNNHKKFVI